MNRLRRFASPSTLFLSLCLFALPWIEIRCDPARPARPSYATPPPIQQQASDWFDHLFPRRGETLLSQTGFQATTGAYWLETDETDPERAAETRAEFVVAPAPLVAIAGILLVIGLLGGLCLLRTRWCALLAGTCGFAAFALLLAQAIVMFPLIHVMVDDTPEFAEVPWFGWYTFYFWLTLFTILISVALAGRQWWRYDRLRQPTVRHDSVTHGPEKAHISGRLGDHHQDGVVPPHDSG